MMIKQGQEQRPQKKRGRIILVLMSDISKHLLEVLERELIHTFNAKVEFRIKRWNLKYAYNNRRKKYSSARLLWRLRELDRKRGDKIMGIVDADIYSPGWEFIFGEAEINSGTAIVSLFLLKQEKNGQADNDNLFEKRVVKEAVHELAHLYRHGHCLNNKCVMYLSQSLADIDRKKKSICAICQS
jgi:archaemetzincin